MTVNYLLNVLVLEIPAARVLHGNFRVLAKDLVAFTIFSQIADRVSAVAAFFLGSSIIEPAGLKGEQEVMVSLFAGVCLNFILSGLAVGLLALFYLTRRWGLKGRRATGIALVAAVITNPAWAMLIQWLISRSGH